MRKNEKSLVAVTTKENEELTKCNKCNNPCKTGWVYCSNCGSKLKTNVLKVD
ncbi:hypothetical protein QN089_05455 [Kurthia sp. YJT4]|uniref:hypothetical protein n=1 Tax=Kurthia TaxID=1649 RepID=UPI00254AA88F|nr:hypothetical protein [Kurthia sp. YJT4]WIL39714.1 hypothetical protein QN089_05455 [Kurthia sp. YJT4]